MTDRPIPFKEPMVRAILADRKTQTRRLPRTEDSITHGPSIFGDNWADSFVLDEGNREWRERCYPWRIGDRLWVRESWRAHSTFDAEKGAPSAGTKIFYIADQKYEPQSRYRHARFMPRWASRLTLVVNDVRVQRLQDITEEDAQAEGARKFSVPDEIALDPQAITQRWSMESPITSAQCLQTARYAFANYFIKLHDTGTWDANPWVAALTFEVHKANIDALPHPPLSGAER